MSDSAFNQNPEFSAMRDNLANRAFRIKVIGSALTLGLVVLTIAAPGLGAFGSILALGASALTALITVRAAKRLEIDQEFLESRMQGRNWWNGYKMEIGGQPDLAITAPSLPHDKSRARSRDDV
jgi:hypothetical protein